MITLRISPTLRSFLPLELVGLDEFPLDLHSFGKEEVAIIDLFASFGLPTDMVTIVIINGKIEGDLNRRVVDGDVVMVSPPIAGG